MLNKNELEFLQACIKTALPQLTNVNDAAHTAHMFVAVEQKLDIMLGELQIDEPITLEEVKQVENA